MKTFSSNIPKLFVLQTDNSNMKQSKIVIVEARTRECLEDLPDLNDHLIIKVVTASTN